LLNHSEQDEIVLKVASYVLLSLKKFLQDKLPGYGVWARENSSHKTMPKDQTSDCVENIRSLIDSSAIHFTGSGLWKQWTYSF